MTVPMRGGTARNLERRTDGAIVARFAELLGTPLLPWQRLVADVAGEIDPDTGTYFYDTVILSTPRQCGKSTLVDAWDTRNTQWGAEPVCLLSRPDRQGRWRPLQEIPEDFASLTARPHHR